MIAGIDLGTTNSLIGLWRDGEARLIPNALGHNLTPSALSLDDNGEIIVGLAARERLLTHPQRTAAAFKRYMGTNRTVTLGDKAFRPEELSALVLKSLRADAEAWLGERIEEAVITVPAYFSDAQRKATRAAGELAGFRVERLLNEPTAAALAYGLQEQKESRIMVVDLGGGTFDVSILELFEGVMEVRATAGDNFLGGEDFVDAIVDAFLDRVGGAAGIPPRASGAPIHGALRRQAELAKRRLSDAETATIELVHQSSTLTWTLSRDEFAELSEPLLKRIRQPIERALRDAQIHPEELSHVVLAGGATRMPVFRRTIARLFRRLPAQTINPEEVVALGAAAQAGLKMQDAALNEVVLTDVAPFTLGVEVCETGPHGQRLVNDLFLPIIERNTVIPASRSKVLHTIDDNQQNLLIRVFQGESRRVSDNIELGKLTVRVPRAAAGKEAVECRFTYDINGILEVEATVISTGAYHRLVIEGNPGVLTQAEIEKRLAALAHLKIKPRDEAENIAIQARAERLYEELLGAKREAVGRWIAEFLRALEADDPKEAARARALLTQRLDQIDVEPIF
ncbi:MAG TPA: molecular chaperone HscC [Stellaceae bacterium]|nr:molecular chaperone HscC [Stellaceae bacterium]